MPLLPPVPHASAAAATGASASAAADVREFYVWRQQVQQHVY